MQMLLNHHRFYCTCLFIGRAFRINIWMDYPIGIYGLQNVVERLLETINRNLWNVAQEMKKEPQRLCLEIEGVLEGIKE